MTEFIFLDDMPPQDRPRDARALWDQVADECRKNPWRTGVVRDVSRSIGSQIKAGNYLAFRDDLDDWCVHTANIPGSPTRRVDLLITYIGTDKPDDAQHDCIHTQGRF